MDNSTKEIVVGKFVPDENSLEDLKEYTKKVLRHEIIHAFFFSSSNGSTNNSEDYWSTSYPYLVQSLPLYTFSSVSRFYFF